MPGIIAIASQPLKFCSRTAHWQNSSQFSPAPILKVFEKSSSPKSSRPKISFFITNPEKPSSRTIVLLPPPSTKIGKFSCFMNSKASRISSIFFTAVIYFACPPIFIVVSRPRLMLSSIVRFLNFFIIRLYHEMNI